jgi:4-coumarate--CoA ligase
MLKSPCTSVGEEYPRAYVVLKDDAKDYSSNAIQEWVQKRVSKHKWLVGGVSLVDEVPKSPSGKILRQIMRQWAKRDAPSIKLPAGFRTVAKNSKL